MQKLARHMFLTIGHNRPFPSVPSEALSGGLGRPGPGTPGEGKACWPHDLCTQASPPPVAVPNGHAWTLSCCSSRRAPAQGPASPGRWAQKLGPRLQLGLPSVLGPHLWGPIFRVRSQWGSIQVSYPHFRDEEAAWAAGLPLQSPDDAARQAPGSPSGGEWTHHRGAGVGGRWE